MAEEEKLSLEVVAPEKMVMSKTVDMVTISGTEGDFGVLPGHAALVSSIRPGFLEIEADKETEKMFIGGGFIEVLEDKVSILATEVLSADKTSVANIETLSSSTSINPPPINIFSVSLSASISKKPGLILDTKAA